MAPPSLSELFTQLSNFVKIIDQAYLFAGENVINYKDLESTAIESLKGDHSRVIPGNVTQLRND